MNINTEEITAVLKELHKITGFRISLRGADFKEVAAYPAENLHYCKYIQDECAERADCHKGDEEASATAANKRDTVIYTCRHGLVEAVSPLYDYGTLTGYLMMGQVLATQDDNAECSTELCKRYGEFFDKIPKVRAEMIHSYVHIMTICARYLTLSNAVPPSSVSLAELAQNYIHENMDKKITIANICDALRCSKTSLLTSFKKRYGTTVNAYITEKRLEIAAKMLTGTKSSIGEVAVKSGFSDQSYFSKVFSAKYGIPPSEYGREIDAK